MRICKIEGCSGKHEGKGFCKKHYQQLRKHGKVFERTRLDPNEIVVKGSIAEVVLCHDENIEVARAIIDAEDIEKIKKYRWCLSNGYAVTSLNKNSTRMHRLILDPKDQTDHKDRDRLNNRKANLRSCTNAQNGRNVGLKKHNMSGYKGVSRHGKKWRGRIMVNWKTIHLGSFKDKVDAAIAYDEAALKYHGEFACLNNINRA